MTEEKEIETAPMSEKQVIALERRNIEKLMETTAGKEVLKENPMIQDYLKSDWAQLKGKREHLDNFMEMCKKYDDDKKSLPKMIGFVFKIVEKFPDKKDVLDAIVMLAIIGVIIHFSPNIGELIFQGFFMKEGITESQMVVDSIKQAYYYVAAWATLMTIILGVVMLGAGSVVKVWLNCRRKNVPVTQLWTKHNTSDFITPKRADLDMIQISKYGALVPNAEDITPTAHRLPLAQAVPELGFVFNPRKLLKGIPTTIDMVTIEEYYELGAREARAQIKDNMGWLKGLAPIVMIILLVYLLAGPTFHEKMMSMNNEKQLKTELLSCERSLINNGIFDYRSQQGQAQSQKPPERQQPDQDAPARGGVGLT